MGSTAKNKKTGDPQVENGYIRIATELYEQLYKVPLNGSQIRIVLFIIRNTYGYHRKTWKMSAGYISKSLNLDIRNVKRELKKLEKLNILIVQHNGSGTVSQIGINKKYLEWKLKPVVNSPRWSNDHWGGGQSATGSGGQFATGTGGQSATQHNIDINNRNKRIEEDKASLRSLGYPDDAIELLKTVGATIAEDGNILTRFGTYVDPKDMDWEGLRE